MQLDSRRILLVVLLVIIGLTLMNYFYMQARVGPTYYSWWVNKQHSNFMIRESAILTVAGAVTILLWRRKT